MSTTTSTKALSNPSDVKVIPLMRGQFLRIAAQAVMYVPGIAQIFYKQAGFTSVHRIGSELEKYEARYNPTVIPDRKLAEGAVEDSEDQFIRRWLARDRPAGDAARYVSVRDFHDAYVKGTTTPTDVANALLALITSATNKKSGHAVAFSQVNRDLVLAAANAATERYRNGTQRGPLDGVPIAVKDQVEVEGYKMTVGTSKNWIANDGTADATSWCVQQCIDAGAVIIGLTNMHELGMDTTNNNPNHGTPLNPHNPKYYTGGSSGGSGYAVSSGLVPFALGADGGGSIRLPSSFCGIYGLKPSHDRLSGLPTRNICASTGVYGPMASTVADLHLAYRIMGRPDPQDANSRMFPPFSVTKTNNTNKSSAPTRKKVIGIYRAWFERADDDVKRACTAALDALVSRHGYTVKDIEIPHLAEGQSCHALTILSEAATAVIDIKDLTHPNQILLTICKAGSSFDLMLAQKLRTRLMDHLTALWKEEPGMLIATPTCATAGWPIKDPADLVYGCSDPTMSLRSMEYVWLANFTGVPALQAPVGYAAPLQGEGEVPVGLMLMGGWGEEERLLEAGYALETYLNEEGRRKLPGVFVDPLKTAAAAVGKA
jgi:Asp-tRNA(Asn)/Glu-tRNA(Gln) amidotransferase A subunit family amidase